MRRFRSLLLLVLMIEVFMPNNTYQVAIRSLGSESEGSGFEDEGLIPIETYKPEYEQGFEPGLIDGLETDSVEGSGDDYVVPQFPDYFPDDTTVRSATDEGTQVQEGQLGYLVFVRMNKVSYIPRGQLKLNKQYYVRI